MSPLSFSITALICAAALIVDAGASDVLINALIGISAVLLARTALADLGGLRLAGIPAERFWAQVALMRLPGRSRRPQGIAQIVDVYGLTPGTVSGMTPAARMAERDRLETLLRDRARLARLGVFERVLPDHSRLRRALSAQAGAAAPSYAAIYDAACLALADAAWPDDRDAAAA